MSAGPLFDVANHFRGGLDAIGVHGPITIFVSDVGDWDGFTKGLPMGVMPKPGEFMVAGVRFLLVQREPIIRFVDEEIGLA